MLIPVVLSGHANIRLKLALSLITAKKVVIKHIRHKLSNPGLNDVELSLLKLIDEVSNGTVVKINDTGTVVTFNPGSLIGGAFTFDCPNSRGLGYFIEFLLLIAPFCKNELDVHLTGVTDCPYDPSVNMINYSFLPIYRTFWGLGSASYIKLEVKKRGVLPCGGGEVYFHTKPTNRMLPIDKTQIGKVYRIRGVAWSCRVNSSYCQRLIAGAKSLLNQFLSDVYITVDHRKGEYAGNSPGFGITLCAESNCGAFYSAESISEPEDSSNGLSMDAETLGKLAASRLFDQISERGFIDCGSQTLAFVLMACETGHNASRLTIGNLTQQSVSSLRLIKDFLGVQFHFHYQNLRQSVEPADTTDNSVKQSEACLDPSAVLVATCFGSGVQNINKSVR